MVAVVVVAVAAVVVVVAVLAVVALVTVLCNTMCSNFGSTSHCSAGFFLHFLDDQTQCGKENVLGTCLGSRQMCCRSAGPFRHASWRTHRGFTAEGIILGQALDQGHRWEPPKLLCFKLPVALFAGFRRMRSLARDRSILCSFCSDCNGSTQ